MKITFLGTGEAFDDELPNTSVLVETKWARILVDCGFSVPQKLWKVMPDADWLDAVYLTHLHADHYFGLPAVFVRLHEDGRDRPLDIIGSADRVRFLMEILDQAYPGFAGKLAFELRASTFAKNSEAPYRELTIRTGRTVHSAPNFAIRIDTPDGKSVMVSGDGEVTPESSALMDGCSLVVHEAFLLTEQRAGHSSVREVLKAVDAATTAPGQIALVHTSRQARQGLSRMDGRFIIPSPGTIISL